MYAECCITGEPASLSRSRGEERMTNWEEAATGWKKTSEKWEHAAKQWRMSSYIWIAAWAITMATALFL